MSRESLVKPTGRGSAAGDPALLTAAIWKIDSFTIHDGPGIRTNVYFQGCPLGCLWCSNPEGQHQEAEPGFINARCRTLSQLMDIIERDRHIYRRSGGGITCTGGETFLQAAFLRALLARCHEVGIHTAVETCGCVGKAEFKATLSDIDWLFFDLKHLDSAEHKRLTGRSNRIILDNLFTASSVLGKAGKILVIRQVVVPGLNDEGNIRALAELARGLPWVHYIELLPYHNYGMNKYQKIGLKYQLEDITPPSEAKLKEYQEIIESYGITCKIGGL